MIISLNKIPNTGLEIHETLDFNETYIKDTDIKELNQVEVTGRLSKNLNQDIILELTATGNMILPDALTLEPITYPFTVEINEKISDENEDIQEYLENKQNTLDIMGILWENIVLEVPMRITKSDGNDLPKSGEGWELMKEKKESIDPRLAPLRELLDNEKE